MKTNLGLSILALLALSFPIIGHAFGSGSPDFSLSTSCEEVYYYCGPAVITVASVNGFAGTVSLTATASPITGITATMSPSSVSVPSGGNATSTLKLTTSCHQFPNCQWDVTVTGASGSLSHGIDIFVCVGRDCPI